jgi:hypothetical protein
VGNVHRIIYKPRSAKLTIQHGKQLNYSLISVKVSDDLVQLSAKLYETINNFYGSEEVFNMASPFLGQQSINSFVLH